MSLLAKSADLIIKSYGQKNPLLSRLELAAQACALERAIYEGTRYADCDDETQANIILGLRGYIAYLACEEALRKSYAFYPLGLKTLFSRLIKGKERWMLDSEAAVMKLLEWGSERRDVAEFVEQAEIKSAEIDPRQEGFDTFHILMNNSNRQYEIGGLRAVFMFVTDVLKREHYIVEEQLNTLAVNHDDENRFEVIRRMYMPAYGPSTSEELFGCLWLCWNLEQLLPHQRSSQKDVLKNFKNLAEKVRLLSSDIHNHQLFSDADQTENLMRKVLHARAEAWMSVVMAMGMTRFYLEYHSDKLDPYTHEEISSALASLYVSVYEDYAEKRQSIGYPLGEAERSWALQRMFEDTWSPVPRPSVEALLHEIMEKLPSAQKKKALKILQDTSDTLEPVVSYYAPQNGTLHKVRRHMFKKAGPFEGQDSYKESFIKHIADNFSDELLNAGLSEQAVSCMRETGKIPETESHALGTLTVDHIIDLHCGGTNHHDNLIVMPEAVNRKKNMFILLQNGMSDRDEAAGYWVIALRPRMNEKKEYPPIIMPRKTSSVPAGQPSIHLT